MTITNLIKDGRFLNITKNIGNGAEYLGSGDILTDWNTTYTIGLFPFPNSTYTNPGLPDESPRNQFQIASAGYVNPSDLDGTCTQNFTIKTAGLIRLIYYGANNNSNYTLSGKSIKITSSIDNINNVETFIDVDANKIHGYIKKNIYYNFVEPDDYTLEFNIIDDDVYCTALITDVVLYNIEDIHSTMSLPIDSHDLVAAPSSEFPAMQFLIYEPDTVASGEPFLLPDTYIDMTITQNDTGTTFLDGLLTKRLKTDNTSTLIIPKGTIIAGATPGTATLVLTAASVQCGSYPLLVSGTPPVVTTTKSSSLTTPTSTLGLKADQNTSFPMIQFAVFNMDNATAPHAPIANTDVVLYLRGTASDTVFATGGQTKTIATDGSGNLILPLGTILAGTKAGAESLELKIGNDSLGSYPLTVSSATTPIDTTITRISPVIHAKAGDAFPKTDILIYTAPSNNPVAITPVPGSPNVVVALSNSGTGTTFYNHSYSRTQIMNFSGILTLQSGLIVAGPNAGTETLTLTLDSTTGETIGLCELIVEA